MNPLSQAIVYLLQVIFGLYLLAVMLRFLFQMVRADFYNPISQALVKVTNTPLIQIRRFIPGLWGIDMASVVLLIVIQGLELFLIGLLQLGHALHPLGLVVLSIASLMRMAIYIFMVALIVRIIMSWINPTGGYNPIMGLLTSLTEPMMRPARRMLPPISGIDLSPILIFVILNLTVILIINPMLTIGASLG